MRLCKTVLGVVLSAVLLGNVSVAWAGSEKTAEIKCSADLIRGVVDVKGQFIWTKEDLDDKIFDFKWADGQTVTMINRANATYEFSQNTQVFTRIQFLAKGSSVVRGLPLVEVEATIRRIADNGKPTVIGYTAASTDLFLTNSFQRVEQKNGTITVELKDQLSVRFEVPNVEVETVHAKHGDLKDTGDLVKAVQAGELQNGFVAKALVTCTLTKLNQ